VTYRRDGEGLDRQASIRLLTFAAVHGAAADLIAALFYAAMPAFCLALGFWVVAVRIRDVRAWLLLGVMLSIATFFNSFPDFWAPRFRTLGSTYFLLQQGSWFAWLFLLGIYFPEPFPQTLRWKWWRWLAWIVLPLWAILSVAGTVSFVAELYSITAALRINRFLGIMQHSGLTVGPVMLLGFIACIAVKYRITSSIDAKRRLRVLYAGAAISLLPLIVDLLIRRLKGVTEEYFSYWVSISVYLIFLLLPVTFAYVIVVERAMDVRVVIRQGLQYTLARRGVLMLRIVLSTVLFSVLALLMSSHAMNPYATSMVLAAGLWSIFLLHGATQRLAVWVDRRFFRDAYNAEQILSDLAEKVRTIIEIQPLLETVAQRISGALHVKQLAVLLDGNELYRPAHALGYPALPELAFSPNAATIQVLKNGKQPTRVYFDDPDSWIYKTSEMTDEERSQLAKLNSELLLPFLVKDDLLGFLSLGRKLSEAPYSSTDLRLLSSVAAQTGLALEVARLNNAIGREIATRERLNRELEIAREVQQHLFPQHFPSIAGLDYSGFCRPAREVGGDYYDFLELPEGKLAIAIGDVSGKGIGASLMMASLGASLRGQAAVVENLRELIQRVNNLVYGASTVNRYATFFYAEYDPRDRQLSFVNAGHNPPLILRRANPGCHLFRLDAGGPPVGLLPNSSYEQSSFALEPADLIVLFTDGISESMNNQDEEWGEERLIDLAKTCVDVPAVETMNRIMTAAQNFAAGAPQHDDMTVVVLRVVIAN
jgi:phosphoserine phosphatase RsbU/P